MEQFFQKLSFDAVLASELANITTVKKIAPKTTLLFEGDVATKIYFIKHGALRLWHNADRKDITLQFFFENQTVCSFESFSLGEPSDFSIESLEETEVYVLAKTDVEILSKQYPELNLVITKLSAQRLVAYTKYFLSRIKETPEERYRLLCQKDPRIVLRVPQIYLSSYLGITPVSLSRIRTRIENSSGN
ncbi:MAG: Crp/Fnr family transcriptional regulator [Enterococcus sp.]